MTDTIVRVESGSTREIEPELATHLFALSQLVEAALSAADVWHFETLVDCAEYQSAYEFLHRLLAMRKHEMGPDAAGLSRDIAERLAASPR